MRASHEYERRLSSEGGDELDLLVRKRDSMDSTASSRGGRLSTSSRPDDGTLDLEYHPRRSIHYRHPTRYLSLFRATVALSTLLAVGLASFAGYWILKFFLLRHDAYGHSVFANPLIPQGQPVEPRVPPFSLPSNPSLTAIQSALDSRLTTLGLPNSTLSCPFTSQDQLKYARLPSGGPYFFALNLYNNQVVLPTLARTLLSLSDFLGRDKTHISIFENGSKDHTTTALAHFAASLTSAGIGHTILSDPRKTDWTRVDRIAQLSVYRNYALAPINDTVTWGGGGEPRSFEEVLFINDVFLCPKDALELLWQRKEQNAHAACAMDWRATESWFGWLGFKSVKFYDNCTSSLLPRSGFAAMRCVADPHFERLQGSVERSLVTCSALDLIHYPRCETGSTSCLIRKAPSSLAIGSGKDCLTQSVRVKSLLLILARCFLTPVLPPSRRQLLEWHACAASGSLPGRRRTTDALPEYAQHPRRMW